MVICYFWRCKCFSEMESTIFPASLSTPLSNYYLSAREFKLPYHVCTLKYPWTSHLSSPPSRISLPILLPTTNLPNNTPYRILLLVSYEKLTQCICWYLLYSESLRKSSIFWCLVNLLIFDRIFSQAHREFYSWGPVHELGTIYCFTLCFSSSCLG